jgi:SOS-response transcriptional repressor LexA
MANLSHRIQIVLNETGWSQAELARKAGTSRTAVSDWLNDKVKNLSAQVAQNISRETTFSISWLATGEGKAKQGFDNNARVAPIATRPIPVISAVQAGALREVSDPYPVGAGSDVIYTDIDTSEWSFALEIDGMSMAPEFQPGDRVIIDPDIAPQPGDFVVAKNGTQEATFKKYRPRTIDAAGNTIFELVPLNQDYPTIRSDEHHLVIIGVMVEHRKYRRKY